MESVPYFEVFRVLAMERNKNLKKFYLYQCSKDPKICSVSVFQFKKHFRTERSVSVGSIPDIRFNPIFVEDLFLLITSFFFSILGTTKQRHGQSTKIDRFSVVIEKINIEIGEKNMVLRT
jgi:hypothetical protein